MLFCITGCQIALKYGSTVIGTVTEIFNVRLKIRENSWIFKNFKIRKMCSLELNEVVREFAIRVSDDVRVAILGTAPP